MRYTDKQREQLKSKFFQRRLYMFALIVPLGGALYMLIFGIRGAAEFDVDPMMLLAGSGGLILAAAVSHWLNWRCPGCGKHLGYDWNPRKCPKCGLDLSSPFRLNL